MEKNSAQTPKPNELPILAHEANALADDEIWNTSFQDSMKEKLNEVVDCAITKVMDEVMDDFMSELDDGSHNSFLSDPTIRPRRQIEGEEEFQVNAFQDNRKINPVLNIAQLEPSADPAAGRPRFDHPGSLFVEGDTDTDKSFEVERLLDKRTIRQGRSRVTQYLVRWKGYEPEWDCWYSLQDLANAKELVEEYETEFERRTK